MPRTLGTGMGGMCRPRFREFVGASFAKYAAIPYARKRALFFVRSSFAKPFYPFILLTRLYHLKCYPFAYIFLLYFKGGFSTSQHYKEGCVHVLFVGWLSSHLPPARASDAEEVQGKAVPAAADGAET